MTKLRPPQPLYERPELRNDADRGSRYIMRHLHRAGIQHLHVDPSGLAHWGGIGPKPGGVTTIRNRYITQIIGPDGASRIPLIKVLVVGPNDLSTDLGERGPWTHLERLVCVEWQTPSSLLTKPNNVPALTRLELVLSRSPYNRSSLY